MSTSPNHLAGPRDRVRELVEMYADPQASVAFLLCDRHPADAVAYTVVDADLSVTVLTYGQLRAESTRFAAGLSRLGVRPGDRVATLMGKSAEYLIALVGIWRLGAVHVPLFTAFAAPAVRVRLRGSAAVAVICDAAQRAKLDPVADPAGGCAADLAEAPWQIVVAGSVGASAAGRERDVDFSELLTESDLDPQTAALGGRAPVVHIYTSGTTGSPKGVVIPTSAIASFRTYLEFGLDVRFDDVYWNAADPGWAYGLYYAVIAPLSMGVPSILLSAGFSPALTYAVLREHAVTNFAAAPTVYRAMRAADIEVPAGLRLRCASSAGEPLSPDVNQWAELALGVPVRDHYGQTETGMVINNHQHPDLCRPLKDGSMGQPMPGWQTAVLLPDRDETAPFGVAGRIAVDLTASPLAWFAGYTGDPSRGAEKFTSDGHWYLTGDVGSVDADGYYHFSARDDDVIIMAGYRIGPFDVESVLCSYPEVVDCAAIAAPDEIRGEVLEAYVVLRDPHAASDELAARLRQLVKTKFAAHAYPRAVHFVDHLPKTPSGKTQRYLLRQQRRAELEGHAR